MKSRPLEPDLQAASTKLQDQPTPPPTPELTHGPRGPALTHVRPLVAILHDGPVDACDQPRAQDAADEQPGEAGAQAQQHIVEEQKVVEVVERFPANRSSRGSTLSVGGGGQAGWLRAPGLWSNPVAPISQPCDRDRPCHTALVWGPAQIQHRRR